MKIQYLTFDLGGQGHVDLGVQGHTRCYPVPSRSCDLCTCSLKLLCPAVWGQMHLQENTLFDLELGVKVIQEVAMYPLHNVTYAHSQFEVATPNSLGEDAFI